jgi:hypothetical protein
MKVIFQARGMWRAVETNTTEKVLDWQAMAAIPRSMPSEYVQTLKSKDTTKLVWDSLRTMRVVSNLVCRAKVQQAGVRVHHIPRMISNGDTLYTKSIVYENIYNFLVDFLFEIVWDHKY